MTVVVSVGKGAVIGNIASIQIHEAGGTLDRVDSASRYNFYTSSALYPFFPAAFCLSL